MAPWWCAPVMAGVLLCSLVAGFVQLEDEPFEVVHPYASVESSPGAALDFIGCSRIRISGVSRIRNIHKFAHYVRVNVEPADASKQLLELKKTQVCFHGNKTLDPCQCQKESWRSPDKGSWSALKSPFQTMYVDVRTAGFKELPVTATLKEEFSLFRVLCFVVGVGLLVAAPIVSEWVPFYYSSAMTMGIILVVIILLFQAMKLLPTGRKSTMYLVLYGSAVGFGTFIIKQIATMLSPVLMQLGLGDDMLKPVLILCLLGIGFFGAYLGYWGVRKFILTEEGDVDYGTAKFVKWAIRLVGVVSLLQSSIDPVFSLLALMAGLLISLITPKAFEGFEFPLGIPFEFSWPSTSSGLDAWRYRKRYVNLWRRKQAGGASSSSPITISGNRVILSPPPRFKLTPDEPFYSTYHRTPERKKMSQAEYEALGRECTVSSMQKLVSSPQFSEWAVNNAERIAVLPHIGRRERPDDEIQATANMR